MAVFLGELRSVARKGWLAIYSVVSATSRALAYGTVPYRTVSPCQLFLPQYVCRDIPDASHPRLSVGLSFCAWWP